MLAGELVSRDRRRNERGQEDERKCADKEADRNVGGVGGQRIFPFKVDVDHARDAKTCEVCAHAADCGADEGKEQIFCDDAGMGIALRHQAGDLRALLVQKAGDGGKHHQHCDKEEHDHQHDADAKDLAAVFMEGAEGIVFLHRQRLDRPVRVPVGEQRFDFGDFRIDVRIISCGEEQRVFLGQGNIDLVKQLRRGDLNVFFLRGVDLLLCLLHAREEGGDGHRPRDARLHGHVDEVAEDIVDRGERLIFVLLAFDLGEADVVAHRHVLRVVHRPREVVFLRERNGHIEVGFQRHIHLFVIKFVQMLRHRRGESITLALCLFGELRRAAFGVNGDRAVRIVRVKAGDLVKLVDAHVRGVVAVINVDAHDAVGNARQRELGIVDDCPAA